jgi:ZIP family zinc transporter
MDGLAGLNPVLQALLATLFTWFVTALGAVPVFFTRRFSQRVMDGMLGLAAGAMIFVVVEELVPESNRHGNVHEATVGAMLGFAVMMTLDVALG